MPIHHQHPPRKKWSLNVTMLVVGGVALAALLMYAQLHIILGESVREQPGQMVRKSPMYNVDISYPVLKTGKVDPTLKAFAEKRADKFVAKIKDNSYDLQSRLTLTFRMPHYGEHTLSVVFKETEEIKGQKSTTRQFFLNFDIASGKQLALGDLFRQDTDARGVVTTVLHDYFRYGQPDTLSGDQLKELKKMPLDKIRDFLLYENTIILYLNPKNLAATDTVKSIAIKKNVLASILNEAYMDTDSGRKPDIKPKPAYVINELPAPPPPPPAARPNTSEGGRIALTFDDGPSAHTNRLLDALAQHNSRATFYVLGHLADDYSGELQRMVREGHEIGNHTWLHPNLTGLSGPQLEHEIGDTQRAIQSVTGGYTPRTYRPPYGATNDTVRAFCANYGLNEVMWTVDPSDWQIHNSQIVYDHVMSRATAGSVILMHDIYGSSVDAAIRAIADLKTRGFQLVTVSELYGY